MGGSQRECNALQHNILFAWDTLASINVFPLDSGGDERARGNANVKVERNRKANGFNSEHKIESINGFQENLWVMCEFLRIEKAAEELCI